MGGAGCVVLCLTARDVRWEDSDDYVFGLSGTSFEKRMEMVLGFGCRSVEDCFVKGVDVDGWWEKNWKRMKFRGRFVW